MTSSRMENTLKTISNQQTKLAMQMKQASLPFEKVSSTTVKQDAMAQTYGKARSEIVDALMTHQRGRYTTNNPYAFLSKQAEADLSMVADKKMALYASTYVPEV